MIELIKDAFSLVRLRAPADPTVADVRSTDRYRRVGLSASASIGARLVAMATALITVPVAVRYLGNEQYGLWATISAVIGLMAFADLGLSNGLINAVSEAYGADDRSEMRRYSSTAFFMLAAIAAFLAVALAVAYPIVPWHRLFNVETKDAAAVAGPSAMIFAAFFLIGLPLSVVQRLRMGLQEGFISSIWQAIGSVVGLVGVLVAVWVGASLPWVVFAASLGATLALVADGGTLLLTGHPWLRPRGLDFDWTAATKVLRLGMLFFVLNIAIVVGYQTDNIVIAQLLGADRVPLYAVPMRLFLLVPTFLGFVFTPMWPMYREALVRGDVDWARRALLQSITLALVVSVPIGALLVLFGVPLVHWWAGDTITPPMTLLVGLGFWSVLSSVGGAFGMFLNGVGVLRLQAICASLMMIANIALSILLTHLMGISGPVWGSAISVALFILLPLGMHTVRVVLPDLSKRGPVRREETVDVSMTSEDPSP